MPETVKISEELPHIRMINDQFQSELAAESHVCEKTIRNLEKARANPRLKNLNCIAAHFCVSVSAFLKLDPSSSPAAERSPNYEGSDPENVTPRNSCPLPLVSPVSVFLRRNAAGLFRPFRRLP